MPPTGLNRKMLRTIVKICVIFVICGPVLVHAQLKIERWERVYTSEAFITQIDLASIRLQGAKIMRIQSRTVLTEPTSIKGNSDPKYTTALQTVDFKLGTGQYRLSETTLLDVAGKVLQTSTADEWRTIRVGGVMDNALRMARAMPPFGVWTIEAYRFADGTPTKRSKDLDQFIGKKVTLDFARGEVNARVCSSLDFQDERLTSEEFSRKLGFDAKAIGVNAESIETTELKCEVSGWRPPNSLLIKVSENEMLMLWNGVFLVLKDRHRIGSVATSQKPTLIRRQPD